MWNERSNTVIFSDWDRGCVSADLDLEAPAAMQFARDFASEAGEEAEARYQIWAGPYELLVAASAAVGAIGGSAAGICAILERLAARHPNVTVQVRLDEETTVTFTGKKLPADVEARVNQFFADRAEMPDAIGTPVADLPQPRTADDRIADDN